MVETPLYMGSEGRTACLGVKLPLKNEKLTKKVVLEQYRLFFDIFKGNLTLRHTVPPSDPMYRGVSTIRYGYNWCFLICNMSLHDLKYCRLKFIVILILSPPPSLTYSLYTLTYTSMTLFSI